MAILANYTDYKLIRAGQVWNLSCSSDAVGTVQRKADQAGGTPYGPVAINGANLTFGPYTVDAHFQINVTAGSVTDTITPYIPTITKKAIIAGGAAGNHTVTGILAGDTIGTVGNLAGVAIGNVTALNGGYIDLTSEFSVTADNIINNTGGTNTTNNFIEIVWNTPATKH